jgi:parallel beta-helix repeat protein
MRNRSRSYEYEGWDFSDNYYSDRRGYDNNRRPRRDSNAMRTVGVVALILGGFGVYYHASLPNSETPVTSSANQPVVCTGGINIAAGSDIEAAVKGNPSGTTFCLARGEYMINSKTNPTIAPLNNDTFIGAGQGKTILDGGNTMQNAFNGQLTGGSNVQISEMTIQDFAPAHLFGAIEASLPSATATSPNHWTMSYLTVQNNTETGISAGAYDVINHDTVSNNGNTGIGSGSAVNPAGNIPFTNGLVVENSVLNHNGYGNPNDAAGSKVLWLIDGTFNNNLVTNNDGPGLWCDGYCRQMTYTNNKVRDNQMAGMFYEISDYGTFSHNLVIGNGVNVCSSGAPFCASAGISISSSNNVAISNNVVKGNKDSIIAFDGHPYTTAPQVYRITVTNNVMIGGEAGIDIVGETGAVEPTPPNPFTTSKWDHNSYPSGSIYSWSSGDISLADWKAIGNDDNPYKSGAGVITKY